MAKKRVLFVFPTEWDAKQLEYCRAAWDDRYEVILGTPDDIECPWDLDVLGYIDEMVRSYRDQIDGVTSSSDYPGATVAGAIATRLGLPGTRPQDVIQCSHKYYSRLVQRDVVPEATPAFHLIDPTDPARGAVDITFPAFIKPVKGAFSVMAQKLNSRDELRHFLARPATEEFVREYTGIFNRLVDHFTDFEVNGSHFLVESFLHGAQVTVEGFATDRDVHILGVTDSIVHPTRNSFARFDLPSGIRPEIQQRMAQLAERVISQLGLKFSLFNIEMLYEPVNDGIFIIEVNPRLCGQFADLYHKVDGVSGYLVALDLATGKNPRLQHEPGPFKVATSFPLRTFEPVRVVRAPSEEQVASVERRFPGTLIWSECSSGDECADFERLEDGFSYRYAVVNVGADSRAELLTTLASIKQELAFEFEPV